MAQQTVCPACGAPLTYTGTAEEIRCPFCDAELEVLNENGQERFRVLSQPGPQKEVLSRPVEGGQPPIDRGQPPSEPGPRTVATYKSPAEAVLPPVMSDPTPGDVGQPPAESTLPPSPSRSSETPTAEMPVPPNVEMPDIPAVVPTDAEEDIHDRATSMMRREDLLREDHPKENLSKEDFTKVDRPGEVVRREDSTRETMLSSRPPAFEERQAAPDYAGSAFNEADRPRIEQPAEPAAAPESPAFHKMHGPVAADVPVTGSVTAAPRRRSNLGPILIALVIGLLLLMACAAGAWVVFSRFMGAG